MNEPTLTHETVALLTNSFGADFFQWNRPSGFVRVKGGYISTGRAAELVLAGKLDPQKNLEDIHREDAERAAPLEKIHRDAAKREAREDAERHAQRRKNFVSEQERTAKIAKSFETAQTSSGVRKM